MDFTLAALKLMCAQLTKAKGTSTPSSFSLSGILFQRAWLQGVLVSVPAPETDDNTQHSRFLLDDGSGVVELSGITEDQLQRNRLEIGKYVKVVGSYIIRDGELPMIKVHKIVDLSAFPHREAMWYLEVIEAYRMFYQPFFEDE